MGLSTTTFDWTESTERSLDIIITETGTSVFGLLDVPLPSHATYVAQILWGSIGWSVGAALGCSLAASEGKPRRTVLFVGDGALQLVSFIQARYCLVSERVVTGYYRRFKRSARCSAEGSSRISL